MSLYFVYIINIMTKLLIKLFIVSLFVFSWYLVYKYIEVVDLEWHQYVLLKRITTTQRSKWFQWLKRVPSFFGMIFVYEQEKNLNFWMCKTNIPLKIYFIDKNWKITGQKKAVPCIDTTCKTYPTYSGYWKYVVEVAE